VSAGGGAPSRGMGLGSTTPGSDADPEALSSQYDPQGYWEAWAEVKAAFGWACNHPQREAGSDPRVLVGCSKKASWAAPLGQDWCPPLTQVVSDLVGVFPPLLPACCPYRLHRVGQGNTTSGLSLSTTCLYFFPITGACSRSVVFLRAR